MASPREDDAPVWTVGFTVSKGTYIRALARDLGRAVCSAAHLVALRRTASGSVGIERCLALNTLSVDIARASALDPVAALDVPALVLSEAQVADVLCGKVVASHGELPAEGGARRAQCGRAPSSRSVRSHAGASARVTCFRSLSRGCACDAGCGGAATRFPRLRAGCTRGTHHGMGARVPFHA